MMYILVMNTLDLSTEHGKFIVHATTKRKLV